MQYRNLGKTDLKVSVIGLGTMTWGEQNTEAEGFEQMDYAVDQGVNFFDTAEMYAIPPKADTSGATERIIGNWFKKNNKRDQVVLATKFTGPGIAHIRNGQSAPTAEQIASAVEGSLSRLQTDYIDLYQLHWPNRKTNFFGRLGYEHQDDDAGTPFLEVLEALNQHIQAGKIRHIGLSNETPWGTMSYLSLAQQHQLPHMVSIQNPYNLLNRSFEIGLSEIAIREKIGLLAYSPLAFGVLSGKYLGGQSPKEARLSLFPSYSRYLNQQASDATARYVKLAWENDLDPSQMALAFINEQAFVTSNLIGATNLTQLKANIASIDLKLSDDIKRRIEEIHTQIPNPAP